MSLSITGYVLEPIRVGAANSPFTLTPDNYISGQVAFNAAYPSDESAPRSEYMVQVLEEAYSGPTGPDGAASLPDARFGYTRNEGVIQGGVQLPFQRFDYSGQRQSFSLLSGSPRESPGTLGADANTTRLKVTSPLINDLVRFPVRLALGDVASGTALTVSLVDEDIDFTLPAVGTVQISKQSGALNWNPADVTTYLGQNVYFQRQSFSFPEESSGNLGILGTDTLLLSPLPTTGQTPLLSIGSRSYLTAVEVPNDGALGTPAAGTFEWSLETGLVRLSAADLALYDGQPLVYRGALVGVFQVGTSTQGTVSVPTALSPIPAEDSDVFFRIPGSRQFPTTVFVDSLGSPKAGTVQVERGSGAVRFSSVDVSRYGTDTVEVVYTDAEVERGITLRLFRSPVDPGNTDSSVKDVTATYTKDGDEAASLADPIIGQPVVFLPALPLDDEPLTVEVTQGTGSFVGVLNRLDTNPPPAAGKGYILDFGNSQLFYGERKVDEIIESGPSDFGAFQMPNFPVFPSNFELEQETGLGSGTYTALSSGVDYILDPEAGVVNLTSTDGEVLVESSGGSITGAQTLEDASTNFSGVAAGDYLVVVSGANEGVYTISSVASPEVTTTEAFPSFPDSPVTYQIRRGVEITADRYWRDVPRVDPNLDVRRVLGATTTPLQIGVDYEVQPGTGFIEFTERMLEDEEVLISYAYLDDDGNKVSITDERGAFLVSKELVQPRPTPTSTLSFNPEGKEVATEPAPSAWRGGRPQRTGDQVIFNTTASTVSFQDDDQVTDALPHGSVVAPNENVYVDYYIRGALGGEKNLTVLNTPMATVQVVIDEEATSFTIEGDRTADFPDQHLLRVDGQEVYLLGAPTYDGTVTTVNLDQLLPQAFKSDFTNPTLETTSGPTPRLPSGTTPSYFAAEAAGYDPIPRGEKVIRVSGDASRAYVGGTVLVFTGAGFQDYNFVEGSVYNSDSDKTEITLGAGVLAQYNSPVVLSHSVRPILASPSAQSSTSRAPVLSQGVQVFRKLEGQPGSLLAEEADYTLDDSGVLALAAPLQPNEAIGLFYTGYLLVPGGLRHRASWNFVVVPTLANGLLNQTLKMSYTTYLPDTFFWRVETLTNLRGEMAEQFGEDAQRSLPSSGPTLENSAGQALYEKGAASVFFLERRFANEDLVARLTLKFYNDAINYLEDYLQAADGRVVGDRDGRFRFDGNIDNPLRTSYDQVTNEIDDRLVVFQSSYVSAITTKVYQASATSRFFPTSRRSTGRVEQDPTETGDIVYNTGVSPLSGISSPAKRFPFAQIAEFALAGSNTLKVDRANGSNDFFRPPFANGMVVEVLGQDGTPLTSGLTISSITDNSPADADIVLSGGLAANIPAGSTLRLSATDTGYPESYAVGITVYPKLKEGLIAYLKTGSLLPFSSPPPTPSNGDYWELVVETVKEGTEPFRFPALDGGTSDDDGDIQTSPILTPLAKSEIAVRQDGTLSGAGTSGQEASLISRILAETQSESALVGSLDAPGTTLTLDSGSFTTTPRAGDLVRILTGTNGPSSWVRVTGGTATTATLEPSFAQDTSFSFLITATPEVTSGSGDSAGTTFTHTGATFVTDGVLPGMTLVITAGANALERRQIVTVDPGGEVLGLDAAFSNPNLLGQSYRIDNNFSTFGGAPDSSWNLWLGALGTLDPVLQDEIDALEGYISTVGSTVVASSGTASGNTLTDGIANFDTSQVSIFDVVWVRSGPNMGFYQITDVPTPTTLEVDPAFPSAVATSYEVLRVTATSQEGRDTVSRVLGHTDSYVSARVTIEALATATVPVVGDAGAYAHGVVGSDLSSRFTEVSNREAELIIDTQDISAVLANIDRLYDTRYAWIDGRINLESGILVKQERAVENRQDNLEQIVTDLIKLLTV